MRDHESRNDHGPSWGDVRAYLDTLGQTYGGCATIELTGVPGDARWQRRMLWARVVFRERADHAWGPEQAKGAQFPHTDHRTMPGLLFRLCTLLERHLDERAQALALGQPTTSPSGAWEQMVSPHLLPPDKGD